MKKHTGTRMILGVLQHLFAAGIMVFVTSILFHSNISVGFLNEERTIRLDPLSSAYNDYEDTEIFEDLFRTEVGDVLTFVAMRALLENNGSFQLQRPVDVTEFYTGAGGVSDTALTVRFRMQDLITWGSRGTSYTERNMNLSEFLNYFGNPIHPDNFAIDEDGELTFAGFYTYPDAESPMMAGGPGNFGRPAASPEDTPGEVESRMMNATNSELLELVLRYVTDRTGDQVRVSRYDDGMVNISVLLLNCPYETLEGGKNLLRFAGNWVDYFALQKNVEGCISMIHDDYELYRRGKELYDEEATNLRYIVRITRSMNNANVEKTYSYTDLQELEGMSDEELTEFVSDQKHNVIYYADLLDFATLSDLTEEDMLHYLKLYSYVYPDRTRIWIYTDSAYPVADNLRHVREQYETISGSFRISLGSAVVLGLLWISIFLFQCSIAGVGTLPDGQEVNYLLWPDRLWIELYVPVIAGCVYGLYRLGEHLPLVIERVYGMGSEELTIHNPEILRSYVTFANLGILTSALFCGIVYSLLRRIRSDVITRYSMMYSIRHSLGRFQHVINENRIAALVMGIQFFVFVAIQTLAVFFVLRFWQDRRAVSMTILALAVLFDFWVGTLMVRLRSQRMEIYNGISRIREGNSEYVIRTEDMNPENAALAEAVNHIGEGIRSAVSTSMRDEQMKSDLITNISHDLKTPLTSIINYSGLLRNMKGLPEEAGRYVGILDEKSRRLKQLLEDLLEASKISSGNVELHLERIDLTELMTQMIGEFEDIFEERSLTMVFEPVGKILIRADSRQMWRVIDNLFQNIKKYALENTRVYVDLTAADGLVNLSVKNVSKEENHYQGEELTERFIRGDESRQGEGSGLGLFIAKSLTQAQGGEFSVAVDGDLFKVNMVFREYGYEIGE
ncbi:MAG: HAMP domain-containing histidine kinase [Lachnospiraceae bacterium]|nr:HAMP domain-containing histidine kinase [Lachnospiraceae bacterium]